MGQRLHRCKLISDQKRNLDECNSKAKPDSYGHYREVQFSQIKLHWAWKLNFIRQKLAKNELSFKYIVLLEEDHFLLPDALHIAKNHILPKVEECPDNELCLGLLGIYPKTFKLIPKNDGITKSIWISGKHNMGMIVTVKWIDNLVKNADLFCNHDDYNWDFSLMKVSQGKVIKGQMRSLKVVLGKNWRVIYPTFPRVFHMGGECGYHTKLHTCNFNAVQKSLDDQLATRKNLYFPDNLKFTNVGGKFPVKFKGKTEFHYKYHTKIKVMVVGEMFVIGAYVNDTSIWGRILFHKQQEKPIRRPPKVNRKFTGSTLEARSRKDSPNVSVNKTVRPRSSKRLMQFLIRFFNILGAIFFKLFRINSIAFIDYKL